MSNTLRASVAILKKSALRLNEITDDATRVVLGVEAFLSKQCSANASACILVSQKPVGMNGSMESTSLCYELYQGKFRIAVSVRLADGPSFTRPWSDADRVVKLETVKMLPELLVRISEVIDARATAAQAVTANASEVLSVMGDPGPRPPVPRRANGAASHRVHHAPMSATGQASRGTPRSPFWHQRVEQYGLIAHLLRWTSLDRRSRRRRHVDEQHRTMMRY